MGLCKIVVQQGMSHLWIAMFSGHQISGNQSISAKQHIALGHIKNYLACGMPRCVNYERFSGYIKSFTIHKGFYFSNFR